MAVLKGRRTTVEKEIIIKNFLLFVFLFKVIPSEIFDFFAVKILGIKTAKYWLKLLLDKGYLKAFWLDENVTAMKNKITGEQRLFYLSKEGLAVLKRNPDIGKYLGGYSLDRYRFKPCNFKFSLFQHNMAVMRSFVLLQARDLNGRWRSEWMARGELFEGNDRRLTGLRIRLPDGVFVTTKGLRVAIECELTLKNQKDSKGMMDNWKHDLMPKDGARKFDVILLVCGTPSLFKKITERMSGCIQMNRDRYLVTTFDRLAQGAASCFEETDGKFKDWFADVRIDEFLSIDDVKV